MIVRIHWYFNINAGLVLQNTKKYILCSHKSIFLSRVEGRGFHAKGEGTKSRVEGNIFFFQIFFLEKVIIDAINVIKTNKKNLKNKWRVNIF